MMRRIAFLLALILLLGFAWAEEEPADTAGLDQRLYQLGYRETTPGTDADAATEPAIRNFQLANGLEETGEFDEETVALLQSDAAIGKKEYLQSYANRYNSVSVLFQGDTGADVTDVQNRLYRLGYLENEPDGNYSDATVQAVCRFQIAYGLPDTGMMDGSTRMRLFEGEPMKYQEFLESCQASMGDSGSNVRRIQRRLKQLGYYTGICLGRFGAGTQQAVSLFQSVNGLDATGEADTETCRLLFSGSASFLSDTYAIRRGNESEDAATICAALKELGYPADENFDMRTETAVMMFQLANGLDATGAVDTATYDLLISDEMTALDDIDWAAEKLVIPAEKRMEMGDASTAMLGQTSELRNSFEYVRYIALKCGVTLIEESQLEMEEASPDSVQYGDIVSYTVEGKTCYGIAAADGAIMCPADTGFVIMRYPEMNEIDSVSIQRCGDGA